MLWLCGILFALIGLVPDETETQNLHPPLLGSGSPSGRTNSWRADALDLTMKKIPLTNSPLKAIVDDEDYEIVKGIPWHLLSGPNSSQVRYIDYSSGRPKAISIHWLILRYPKGLVCDHKNHNTLDNRRQNLRVCTHEENCQNRIPQRSNRSSRFKGVSWKRNQGKWEGYIRFHTHKIHLGTFCSEEEAARSYDCAARTYFGEFAFLNFSSL
jgi:hypothetical protein